MLEKYFLNISMERVNFMEIIFSLMGLGPMAKFEGLVSIIIKMAMFLKEIICLILGEKAMGKINTIMENHIWANLRIVRRMGMESINLKMETIMKVTGSIICRTEKEWNILLMVHTLKEFGSMMRSMGREY